MHPSRIYYSQPLLFIILFFECCLCQTTPPVVATTSASEAPLTKLLVVVIDGLRWDAINTSHVRHDQCPTSTSCPAEGSYFTQAQKEGATAAWMVPVFPTTTAPNIMTMVTGELPVDHGVLGELQEHGEWNMSEVVQPVWQTTTQRRLKTALLRWTDCNALYYESEYLLCADRVQLTGTENLLVELTGDAALAADMFISEGYSVVLMRTEIISWTARHYGVNSLTTATMMTELELVLDGLFAELKDAGLWDQLNVIVTSGSGLSSTEPSALEEISVSKCLEKEKSQLTARFSSAGSVLLAVSGGLTAEQVMTSLDNCSGVHRGAFKSYKMTDLAPEDRWPGDSQELLVVSSPGYFLKWDADGPFTSLTIVPEDVSVGRGSLAGDGFSVLDWDMNAVLIAKGPGIVEGVTGEAAACTDVHALMLHMLTPPQQQQPSAPEGGTLGDVQWMVDVSAASVPTVSPVTLLSVILFFEMLHQFSVFN